MTCARRSLGSLLLALALAWSGPAAAAPTPTERIFSDYVNDLQINGRYDPADVEAALATARANGAGYETFADAVQEVYDRDILGLDTGSGDGLAPQPREERSTLLPEPRGPGERDRPPWPFLAMSALAGALVVSGAGSSIYRRVHR